MPDSKKDVYEEVAQKEPSDEAEESVGLKPKMTLLNGITVIVGSIIGSGIFISPTGVLANTGSVNLSLIVWVTSGIFSMIGAYCYAELGCMIQKTGADYAYIMTTFGPFLAFIRLWVECMIVRPCSQTIVALTFSAYIMKPFFPTCESPDASMRLLAAVCILVLTFINCWSVKWATRVQDIFTAAKLLALFVIIITGFVQLGRGQVQYFTFENTEPDFSKIILSFYSGLFAYNGWNYLNFVIEELIDPVKNLPRAIYISITLVTVVYVLTNVAFYTTLSPAEVLGSEAVAVTFADRLYGNMAWIIPFFVACSTFGAVNGVLLTSSRISVKFQVSVYARLDVIECYFLSPWMIDIFIYTTTFADKMYGNLAFLVPIFVALSTFGSVNGILFTSSRLFYAGALEGQMPQILTMIQIQRMTPTPAVLFMAFLSLIYLGSSDIYRLISYVGFATWISIGLAVLCVPWLRWKCPDMERPIRVPLVFPVIYIIATIIITIVPMIAAPVETGIGCIIIATGVPVYLIFIKLKKPARVKKFLDSLTVTMQKSMLVLPSEKKST